MDQLVQMLGQFVAAHPYTALGGLVGLWFISNVASAMPSPSQSSSPWYKFFFTLIHSLVGSIPRLLPSLRLPGDPSKGSQSFYGAVAAPPAPAAPAQQSNTPPPPSTPVH